MIKTQARLSINDLWRGRHNCCIYLEGRAVNMYGESNSSQQDCRVSKEWELCLQLHDNWWLYWGYVTDINYNWTRCRSKRNWGMACDSLKHQIVVITWCIWSYVDELAWESKLYSRRRWVWNRDRDRSQTPVSWLSVSIPPLITILARIILGHWIARPIWTLVGTEYLIQGVE